MIVNAKLSPPLSGVNITDLMKKEEPSQSTNISVVVISDTSSENVIIKEEPDDVDIKEEPDKVNIKQEPNTEFTQPSQQGEYHYLMCYLSYSICW